MLNRCLQNHPDTIILSEINPVAASGKGLFKPHLEMKRQMSLWYGIEVAGDNFFEVFDNIFTYTKQNKKHLLIRDWTFVNFTKCSHNNFNVSNDFELYKSLLKYNPIVFSFVRNSIDVWISRGKIDINIFYNDYYNYVNQLHKYNLKIFKYEDLVSSPVAFFNELCSYVGINFDNKLLECQKTKNYKGDMGSRGIKKNKISFLRRKFVPIVQIKKLNNNEKMKEVNKLLSYKVEYKVTNIAYYLYEYTIHILKLIFKKFK